MKVFKFGGISISSADNIRKVTDIILMHKPDAIIFSAMGKMTNLFEKYLDALINNSDTINALFKDIKTYHLQIINDLFEPYHSIHQIIDSIFEDILSKSGNFKITDPNCAYGTIIPYGEWLSVNILSHYLKKKGIENELLDARNWLETDKNYLNAKVNTLKSCNNLQKAKTGKTLITQGFVGGYNGITTTLGREGSDYTAALVSSFLKADSLTIWKDVDGLLNADPKFFTKTKVLSQISYDEAVELAFYGAKIIHPKTIKPLQNSGIPLYIKSFIRPSLPGTIIYFDKTFDNKVSSFILKKNQMLLTLKTKDFSFMSDELLSLIYDVLKANNLTVSLMQRSAITLSLCTDYNYEKLKYIIDLFENKFIIRYNEKVELLTIRNYTEKEIEKYTSNKEILIEQRSRINAQFVIK